MGTSKLLVALFLLHLIAEISPAASQLDLWSHGCIDTNGNYTSNSTYKSNLHQLLTRIPTANISYGFYNFSAGQDPDQANAIALCRGDVEVDDCNTCLNFVISQLAGLCPNQKEAIGWADNCMVRYSDRSILGGQWENNPYYKLVSGTNATDIDQFANDVQELLRTLPNKTASGDSRLKFATGEAKLSDSQNVYALMQCTPDLPPTDCLGCLYWANYYILNTGDVLRGQTGARVLLPSCYIRYESQKFYSDSPTSITAQAAAAAPSSLTSSGKGSRSPKVVIIVVLGVLACLSLLAWRSWTNGKALDIVDPMIAASGSQSEMTRCIHLGLLCVQESVENRPTMSSVIRMLSGQSIDLPVPSHPAYIMSNNKPLPAIDRCSSFLGALVMTFAECIRKWVGIWLPGFNTLLVKDKLQKFGSMGHGGYLVYGPGQDSLGHFLCIDGKGNYTANSTFKSNLNSLLTKISTTDIAYGFYNFSAGKDPDQAYLIALCRGDVGVSDCHTCLDFVTTNLTSLCPNQKEVNGWADNCMLRYPSRDILSGFWENDPIFELINGDNVTGLDHFINVLQGLLGSLTNSTASGDSRLKYATGEANVTASQNKFYLSPPPPQPPKVATAQSYPATSGKRSDKSKISNNNTKRLRLTQTTEPSA
ncbi:hypothetical protein V2J09_019346 [Rumex salicifolius]